MALHDRWHGAHRAETDNIACARLSGAFDDAAAAAPLIAGWLDTANGAGRTALLRAAADCDRVARIGSKPSRDSSPADLKWWDHEDQSTLRRLALAGINVRDVGDWLRTLARRQQ